jgi:sigma-E factor negative regulatory protein RseC
VVRFQDDKTVIKITSHSACASCHASGICGVSELNEKLIHCITDQEFKAGERVQVIMEEKMGWIAIFYSYIAPFLVMLVVLFGLYFSGLKEEVAALAAMASLIPYYGLLFLCRKKIEKDIVFKVVKLTS